MSSLIIYYSKTGHTKLVSNVIRQSVEGDIIEIKDINDKKEDIFGYITKSIHASVKAETKIEPKSIDLKKYNTIFIGTPVWASTMTPAIYTLLNNMDLTNKQVILFNTMKYSGGYKTMQEMMKLVRKNHGKIVATFTIVTVGNHPEIINRTNQALENLNLK